MVDGTGSELVLKLDGQRRSFKADGPAFQEVVHIGLSVIGCSHCQFEIFRNFDGFLIIIETLYADDGAYCLLVDLKIVEIIHHGGNSSFAEGKDILLISIEDAGVVRSWASEWLIGEELVKLSIPYEGEVFSLSHEIVAVDQYLLVEEAHILNEHAFQIRIEIHWFLQWYGVRSRTIGEDDGCSWMHNHYLPCFPVEISPKDLVDEWNVLDDHKGVVLQNVCDVADGEGTDQEDVFCLIQWKDDPYLLIWVGPWVNLHLKWRFLKYDNGNLLYAPTQHHSLLVFPAAPAIFHFKTSLYDAYLGTVHRVLHSCKPLTIPEKGVKLIE